MFLSGFLDAVFTRLDSLIIGKLFQPETLGFFERAKSLDQLIINYSSGSLMSVLFPILTKVKNDLPRFQQIIIKSLGILSFVVFMLLGLMYLTSEELIVILFTEKWLTSVNYFKILVLSGFAYPLSALLVNVLSSRGNSKAFLRLEIYKKILASLNLAISFMWGIEGYLYGLIIASTLALFLNIVFASEEIKVSLLLFIKPIIGQMFLSVIVVFIIIQLINILKIYALAIMLDNIINSLIFKSSCFIFLYMTLSKLFKTTSYKNFSSQILLNNSEKS
jgi:O-antigen/teichoic acid export membrane protein